MKKAPSWSGDTPDRHIAVEHGGAWLVIDLAYPTMGSFGVSCYRATCVCKNEEDAFNVVSPLNALDQLDNPDNWTGQ